MVRWNKELDEKLLKLISNEKRKRQIEISMKMSYPTFLKRLKEMGFDGLADARNVMTG
jgi:hypothetical protein